ncbi:Malolactic enzyme [Staphylococcus aureus]|nr:Malolactic enzyme [Staphylococcus aureus]
MKGIELLNNPFLNKGTAFTNEERKQLGLEGLLPANVRTLEQQAEQCYEQFKAKQTDFEKRLFLMAIFNRNRTLFYKLTSEHLVEFMPIIYDPVLHNRLNNIMRISADPKMQYFYLLIDKTKLNKNCATLQMTEIFD